MIDKAQTETAAHRYQWEAAVKKWWGRAKAIDPEHIVENMTGVMFRIILFFGVPYCIYIFFKFLSLKS
ncbi:hypothetical protein [Caenibacillus caldisaponilyticus]|uniref:hypothetical protein n=1 Tax=Caenibacillus caldisaponilyticus TaxID=1674942 RepID=UPI0009886841|nr:hypothetical protein [Caenibacillus caldisaponilyticus]